MSELDFSYFGLRTYCVSLVEKWCQQDKGLVKDILGTRMKIMWKEQLVEPILSYGVIFGPSVFYLFGPLDSVYMTRSFTSEPNL